ncbi:MAG: hypothetical protein JWN56_11 [Sphingobacteriales bacterium]|nr:hypothetical protein [Sphingobacteriales bacterium]
MKTLAINYLSYNHWANQKICNYLSNITDEQLLGSQKNDFNIIKKIILHIADGEQTWLSRLNGDNIPHMHNLDLDGSFSSICRLILKNSEEFISFIQEKDDDFLKESTEYINLKGKSFTQNNAEIILHCMNHSTFHRGQIINMLRHVGYTDQSASDFIMYLRESQVSI